MSFLLFTKYNNVYPPLGCTHLSHHTPYFIYTPIKLENLINFALKNSNLALHGIYVLCKIKYPIASWGLCPPDPLLQRYNFRISPSPQKILDPPLHSYMIIVWIMPILAIMIPYIVWTMIMYAVIIMTYHSGDNHNVAMVKICKVYMDDDNVAMVDRLGCI